MDAMVAVKLNDEKHPQYYLGMLEGRPLFGPKTKAVRMTDALGDAVVRQLQQGWKLDCWLMNGFVRFGSKPKEPA